MHFSFDKSDKRSGVDVNAAHAVLSDNGTLVANTLSSCNLSCLTVCVSSVFSS
jgi:hypothetical protein